MVQTQPAPPCRRQLGRPSTTTAQAERKPALSPGTGAVTSRHRALCGGMAHGAARSARHPAGQGSCAPQRRRACNGAGVQPMQLWQAPACGGDVMCASSGARSTQPLPHPLCPSSCQPRPPQAHPHAQSGLPSTNLRQACAQTHHSLHTIITHSSYGPACGASQTRCWRRWSWHVGLRHGVPSGAAERLLTSASAPGNLATAPGVAQGYTGALAAVPAAERAWAAAASVAHSFTNKHK